MSNSPAPVYTVDNCTVAYQLNRSYSLFWNTPQTECAWFPALRQVCEQDGVRLLEHEFKPPNVSQFLVSTTPSTSPTLVAQRIKGRLQYLVRRAQPKAFRRNYSIRSIGSTRHEKLDAYIVVQNHRSAGTSPTGAGRFGC